MANKPLQAVSLVSPGFFGINSQDELDDEKKKIFSIMLIKIIRPRKRLIRRILEYLCKGS